MSVGLLGLAPWVLLPNPVERRMAVPDVKTSKDVSSLNEPIYAIPQRMELDARKVALGQRLFHETRLSGDNTIACASCHDLSKAGTDQLPRSIGIDGRLGTVNAPTVFNSGFNFKQFWDGRADTLEAQIDGPIHAPKEMRSNWPDILRKLEQDPSYVAAFASLYGRGIRPVHVKDAIATFERSLLTPNSRFDKFLRGDGAAITAEEQEGYLLFKSLGCVACHQGVSVGGNMFQTFGVMADYFAERGGPTAADLGRFNVTGREQDRYRFKVPSLRNVDRTAPYFHDGSATTLEQAVAIMARYQLGRTLASADVDRIVKFLRTLTGEYNGRSL
jgi:cytochrome c peroxidase